VDDDVHGSPKTSLIDIDSFDSGSAGSRDGEIRVAAADFNDLPCLVAQAQAQDELDQRVKADGVHPNPLLPQVTRPGAVFVSDWNGEHPYLARFLGDFADRRIASLGALNRYSHLEEDPALAAEVLQLHAQRYGEPALDEIAALPGTGSASFLATLLFRARQLGFDRLCYLPPVYNSAAHLIAQMGFAVHKAAPDVDFAPGVTLDLPDAKCVLWLTDPVWFAGRRVRQSTIETIAAWQRRTGSLVLVDGTFQYLQWEAGRTEWSTALDPRLTYRLVCPTKALAIHGFRFAYLLVPAEHIGTVTHLHSCLHGAAGVADRAFAHRALAALASPEGNAPLLGYAQRRLEALCAADALREWVEPECGYFVFARPTAPPDTMHGMGPECFEVRGRHGYVRINLLSDRAFAHLTRSAQDARTIAVGTRT
jgi:aspartate/methionine/tyrosine aminotransferase